MKKNLLKGAACLVLGGLVAACSNDETWTSVVDSKLKAYDEVFHGEFGTIAPNHSWGFSSNTSVSAARMTRGHNADGNMWAKYGYNVPDTLTDAMKDKVRRWFQQHKNPQGTAVNYTTFFVQDVYKGGTNVTEDSQTTEYYMAANGDEFYGSNQMDWLTAGSGNDHINNYNNGQCSPNKNVWDGKTYRAGYTPTGNMDVDFNFAQQHTDKIMLMVDSKTDCFGYTNSRQGKQQYNDKYVIIPGDSIQAWDKRTTINGQLADVSGMFFVGFDYEADLKHGWNSTTNSNGYLATEVTEGTAGAFQVPNEGPYKGKWVVDGAADGYYSDWIVRITEGTLGNTFKPESDIIPIKEYSSSTEITETETTKEYYERTELVEQGRVFCEDLGQISANDLDFNDVVFDAYIYKKTSYTRTIVRVDGVLTSDETEVTDSSRYAEIILLAAGGTLPLQVADREVHDAFGHYSTVTIVNTITGDDSSYGNQFVTRDPVNLGFYDYSSIIDIPITIYYNTETGDVLTLDAKAGMAPHKILVPIGTKWARERVKIDDAYTGFRKYVTEVYDFWNGDKKTEGLFYHEKDTYGERSTDPVITLLRTEGPTTTYSEGSTTVNGGYQGEEVLSRKLR